MTKKIEVFEEDGFVDWRFNEEILDQYLLITEGTPLSELKYFINLLETSNDGTYFGAECSSLRLNGNMIDVIMGTGEIPCLIHYLQKEYYGAIIVENRIDNVTTIRCINDGNKHILTDHYDDNCNIHYWIRIDKQSFINDLKKLITHV